MFSEASPSDEASHSCACDQPIEKKTHTPEKGLMDPRAADAIAIISSLAVALGSGWLYTERNVYKNISSLGGFDDVKPVRKEHFHDIMDKARSGEINRRQSFHMIDNLIEHNELEASARMRNLGIRNFADRWAMLRNHQKLEVLTIAVAAGSVALGSILSTTREWVANRRNDQER